MSPVSPLREAGWGDVLGRVRIEGVVEFVAGMLFGSLQNAGLRNENGFTFSSNSNDSISDIQNRSNCLFVLHKIS